MTLATSRVFVLVTALSIGATSLFAFEPSAQAQGQMSETEKKAAARSAYTEGVQLEDSGKYAEALARFEAAQKLYDAPTHQLHIARCQAKTGRLVEAAESYEALTRRSLPADAPDAFKQAQEQAKTELGDVRPRIPTLRVVIKPDPSQMRDLRVSVNGTAMPNELVNIARPINPGTYRVQASAQGYVQQANVPDTALAERESKSVEITLVPGNGPAVVAAPVGAQPPPYAPQNPNQPNERPGDGADEGPGPFGLLLGGRVGGIVPGGDVDTNNKMENFAAAGGGFGLDAYARLAKMLLLGLTFEYGALGSPSTINGATGSVSTTASTTYFGAAIGIVPNVDKVTFIGDLGVGSRSAKLKASIGSVSSEASANGVEFQLGAGISIPLGKLIRLVPLTKFGFGSFTEECAQSNCQTITSSNRSGHTFFFVGVGLYFNVDFKRAGAAAQNAPPPVPYRTGARPKSTPTLPSESTANAAPLGLAF